MDHEKGLSKFMVPSKQERYEGFLSTPRGRKKFIGELAHFGSLDPKSVVTIPSVQHKPLFVARLLVSRGATSRCWVISENPDLDGREMDLNEALIQTIGRGMGTFISCVPGRLAYFEDEDGRCILQR
jgi:hypothetical protein